MGKKRNFKNKIEDVDTIVHAHSPFPHIQHDEHRPHAKCADIPEMENNNERLISQSKNQEERKENIKEGGLSREQKKPVSKKKKNRD